MQNSHRSTVKSKCYGHGFCKMKEYFVEVFHRPNMHSIDVSFGAKHLERARDTDIAIVTTSKLNISIKSGAAKTYIIPSSRPSPSPMLVESDQCRASILPVPSSSQYTLFVVCLLIEITCATTVTCIDNP
jgi:hypothetical protein